MAIKDINRLGIAIIPQTPFLEWLEAHLGRSKNYNMNCDIFLFEVDDDFTIHQLPDLLKKNHKDIFENILNDWSSNRSIWPEISYEIFTSWFEIKYDFFVQEIAGE